MLIALAIPCGACQRRFLGVSSRSVVTETFPAERAAFITKTYLHLFGAIALFTVLEVFWFCGMDASLRSAYRSPVHRGRTNEIARAAASCLEGSATVGNDKLRRTSHGRPALDQGPGSRTGTTCISG